MYYADVTFSVKKKFHHTLTDIITYTELMVSILKRDQLLTSLSRCSKFSLSYNKHGRSLLVRPYFESDHQSMVNYG